MMLSKIINDSKVSLHELQTNTISDLEKLYQYIYAQDKDRGDRIQLNDVIVHSTKQQLGLIIKDIGIEDIELFNLSLKDSIIEKAFGYISNEQVMDLSAQQYLHKLIESKLIGGIQKESNGFLKLYSLAGNDNFKTFVIITINPKSKYALKIFSMKNNLAYNFYLKVQNYVINILQSISLKKTFFVQEKIRNEINQENQTLFLLLTQAKKDYTEKGRQQFYTEYFEKILSLKSSFGRVVGARMIMKATPRIGLDETKPDYMLNMLVFNGLSIKRDNVLPKILKLEKFPNYFVRSTNKVLETVQAEQLLHSIMAKPLPVKMDSICRYADFYIYVENQMVWNELEEVLRNFYGVIALYIDKLIGDYFRNIN